MVTMKLLKMKISLNISDLLSSFEENRFNIIYLNETMYSTYINDFKNSLKYY